MQSHRYFLHTIDGRSQVLPPTCRPVGTSELRYNRDAFTSPFEVQSKKFGDNMPQASPVTLRYFIDCETEEEAIERFIHLKIFLEQTVRVARGNTWYRELVEEEKNTLYISRRHPEGLTSSLEVQFALLCKFPEWTRGVVSERADYLNLAEVDKTLL